jgi:putative two-component system response regulator
VVGKQTELLQKQIVQLKSQEKQLRKMNSNIIDVMSSVVEFRNLESGLHVKRIRKYSLVLANTVMANDPEYHLIKEKVEMIASASALHDVGKIGIPDSVLLKPGKLTPEEFEVMKTHTPKVLQSLMNWNGSRMKRSIRSARTSACITMKSGTAEDIQKA